MIYTTSQVQKGIERGAGSIQDQREGQLFVASPVRAGTAKKSPFEVHSISLPN